MRSYWILKGYGWWNSDSYQVGMLRRVWGTLWRTVGYLQLNAPFRADMNLECTIPMQHLDYFQVFQDDENIAEGVTLPSGQFALCWHGLCHSHGVFPSFERFKEMQAKRSGRSVEQINSPPTADGCSRTFYLQRNEDWSGISGTCKITPTSAPNSPQTSAPDSHLLRHLIHG